jgi:oligopeptide/dipeptide ABC transporter ATP-binding protein
MDTIFEARDLIKRYKVRQSWTRRTVVTAVDQVSFTPQPGQTVAIVGESGCGKTTVGKLLLGLVQPDGGEVFFRGRPILHAGAEARLEYRRAVQMVFQNPIAAFNPMMTIGESLVDAMRLRRDLGPEQRRAEAVRLLQRVGLDPAYDRRYPSEMSGGQLQRVGIARALAPDPRLVFLDEPTSALDMSVRGQIINLLLDLQAEYGLGYVLISHDLRVVRAMAHYVLVMYLGQVVEEGPASGVLEHPLHPYTKGLLAATLVGQRPGGEPIEEPSGEASGASDRRAARVRGEVLQLPADYRACKLVRRCPFEKERCSQEPQVLEAFEPGHLARCWRVPEINGRADMGRGQTRMNADSDQIVS